MKKKKKKRAHGIQEFKEYYSAIKKEWNNAIHSNTDATRDSHTKWSKSEREKQIPYNIT